MAWASIKNDKVVAVAFKKEQLDSSTFLDFIEIPDNICNDVLVGKLSLSCIDTAGNVITTHLDSIADYKKHIDHINHLATYPCMMSIADKNAMITIAKLIPENGIAVEIGSRLGGSAKLTLDHAKKSIHLYCIDVEWKFPDVFNAIRDDKSLDLIRASHPEILNYKSTYDYALHLLKNYDNVTLLPGSAPYDFQYWDTPVDFVFEDSSHENPQLKDNLDFWWDKLKYNGVMAGHDYSQRWSDIIKEVNELAEKTNCKLHTMGDVWWLIKRVNVDNHVSGFGKFLYMPHWKCQLFNNVDDNLLINRHFFIWDWRHLFGNEIADAFPWEEFNRCRELHPTDKMSVILDNSMEAPDYYNHLKPLCDKLIASGILPKNILLWSTIEEPDDIPVSNIDTKIGYAIGINKQIPNYDTNTNYHFVMLAKNPRPLRLMIADQILNRHLDRFGNISCGSCQWDHEYETSPYLSDNNKHKFPILLDGVVLQDDIKQYDVSDNRISQAAINVICETSQDAVLDGVVLWTKPFITEKTSKAFLLCQFPLMVSVPGMVDKLRRHGFDMFDDIIDHSYDNELDPWQRIHMISDQLETLCNITDIAALRSQHWDRLLLNRQQLLKIVDGLNSTNVKQLEQWLKDTQ